MKKIVGSILISMGILPLIAQSQHEFKINGVAAGIKDKTLLYLEYTQDQKTELDSAVVTDEKFLFVGKLNLPTVNALIRTRDYSDYKFVWLENSTLSFHAKKGNFRDAIIGGSKTQLEQDRLNQLLKTSLAKDQPNIEKQYIRNNPDSWVSVHLLNVYCSTWGKDSTAALFLTLSDALKESAYGKDIANFLSLNRNIQIGDSYVDFEQFDTQNNLFKLSSFSQKVVLLEFWGSWCGPCRKANPELVKIYGEFKNQGFEIVGVGAETKRESWLQAIKEDNLPWTNVTDLKGSKNKAALIYSVSYYPTNFLIDKDGKVIARDLKGNALRKKLKEILKD